MIETPISKILSFAEDIRHFNNGIKRMEGWESDPVTDLMVWQYEMSKDDLLKEMIIEMANIGITLHDFEKALAQLSVDAKKTEKKSKARPHVSKSTFQEVERMVAAA